MKRVLLAFILFIPFCLHAQTDGISYQAVIIDNNDQEIPGVNISGNYLSNGQITLRFSILDQFEMTEYQETQELTTDEFGLVNAVIGWGESTGVGLLPFQEIDWDGTPRRLRVELKFADTDFMDFGEQELVYVPYAAHRNITASGTLAVDGATTLRDTLVVADQAFTLLTGDLTVQGDASFEGNTLFNSITVENESDLQGDLIVGGPALFESTVDVAGETTLESTLSVQGLATMQDGVTVSNESQATFTGPAQVEGVFTANSTSALNGQVTIDALVTGSSSNFNAYPLRVRGSNQGIAIRVNGTRNASKNFATFFDGSGQAHGRIEGQTLSELESSFRFLWDFTMAGLEEGFLLAEGVACGFQLDGWEAGVMVTQAAVAYAKWIELTLWYTNNAGVQFSSGGADYAEWLELADPGDTFFPGEVVGVRSGKISRITEGAHHVLAISTNPIVLGNMPAEGREADYEKVAFLGQVPIRVVGPVSEGDYILPSRRNDGLAVAMKPAEVPSQDLQSLIGVAWESNQSDGMHVVNVAIGLTQNDLAGRVADLESELDALRTEMAEIKAMLAGTTDGQAPETMSADNIQPEEKNGYLEAVKPSGHPMGQSLTDAEFEAWLDQAGPVLEAKMAAMRQVLEQNGSNYQQYPDIALILENPVQALRDMRSGKFLESVWVSLEKQHLSK